MPKALRSILGLCRRQAMEFRCNGHVRSTVGKGHLPTDAAGVLAAGASGIHVGDYGTGRQQDGRRDQQGKSTNRLHVDRDRTRRPAPGLGQDGNKASATLGARPEWRNGRRSGLKLRGPQGRQGSNPCSGTTYPAGMSILAILIVAAMIAVVIVLAFVVVDR
jgi:hypothetical protein